METDTLDDIYPQPSRLAWTLGIISVVVFFTLAWTIDKAGDTVRRTLAYRHFLFSFNESDYDSARKYLDVVIGAGSNDSFDIIGRSKIPRSTVDGLFKVLEAANKGKALEAEALYRNAFGASLSTRSFVRELADPKIPRLAQEIEAAFGNLKSADSAINALKERQTRNASVAEKNLTEFHSLAHDFADFLGITVFVRDDAPISVYSTGVLAGLPTVPALRDDIADLAILREELTAIHGGVKVKGERAKDDFEEKIANYRNLTASVLATQSDLNSEEDELNTKLEVAEVNFKGSKNVLIFKCESLLLALTGAEVSEWLLNIFETL